MTVKTIEVMAIVDNEGNVMVQLPRSIEAGEHRVMMTERVQLRVLGIAISFHLIDCPIAHLTAE